PLDSSSPSLKSDEKKRGYVRKKEADNLIKDPIIKRIKKSNVTDKIKQKILFYYSFFKDSNLKKEKKKPYVESVIREKEWITQEKGQCFKACQAILISSGFLNPATGRRIYTAKESEDHKTISLTKDAKAGVDAINKSIKNNTPIIVGVHHTLNYGINSGSGYTTDHFVVIVGMGVDKSGKVYYRFFEVGTQWKTKGVSKENKLYLHDDYSLRGSP